MSAPPLLREKLLAGPQQVLARLPSLGRLMIVAQHGGATHERLGSVEGVVYLDQRALCRGACHDCDVDLDAVDSIVIDRSGRMKDTVLPRIEFLNAGGDGLFRVVGLEGLEKFDQGLAGIAGAALPEPSAIQSAPSAEVSDSDPGALPLQAACDAGTAVTVELRGAGITQRWRGIINAVRPAMGFVNVITDDFHLHLRGGAVAAWKSGGSPVDGEAELIAADGNGDATGLVLRGPERVFATRP
jgi:putative heme degradation protein